jgi:TfoX/Sxy family transcriptional regulator of competence genes
MKIAPPEPTAIQRMTALTPDAPGVETRKLFGQPAVFVNGNLFLGVFGPNVFVRLSEKDRAEAKNSFQAVAFEPMPGRPMKEYVVLPASLLDRRAKALPWVARSLAYASGMPPKVAKRRAR